jgi:hypothetical protein
VKSNIIQYTNQTFTGGNQTATGTGNTNLQNVDGNATVNTTVDQSTTTNQSTTHIDKSDCTITANQGVGACKDISGSTITINNSPSESGTQKNQ